jgi:hypothetical protein
LSYKLWAKQTAGLRMGVTLRSCLKFTLNIISVVIAKPFPIKIKEKRLRNDVCFILNTVANGYPTYWGGARRYA